MATMKEYRNYIFDLYGTLVDIHTDENLPTLWQGAANILEEWNIRYTPTELRTKYLEICAFLTERKKAELAERGIPGPEEIELTDVWDALADCKGEKLTEGQKLDFSRIFRKLSTLKLRLYPDAKELLHSLQETGKTVCLLTNAQASFTLPELEELGISNDFDHIFISSSAGVKKPGSAFFSQLWNIGLHPENCLMIGNDDICDCHGAAAVGMDSLYIRTEQSPEPKLPLPQNCFEIRTLQDILYFIHCPVR